MKFTIEKTDIRRPLGLLAKLPEFDNLKPYEHYAKMVDDKVQLNLVAKNEEGHVIGCKMGYDRYADGSFYSWLGGVRPEVREMCVAQALADYQENWARENGFTSIKFKTMNRHQAMLLFSIKNGFQIYNVKPKADIQDYRIELIKNL